MHILQAWSQCSIQIYAVTFSPLNLTSRCTCLFQLTNFKKKKIYSEGDCAKSQKNKFKNYEIFVAVYNTFTKKKVNLIMTSHLKNDNNHQWQQNLVNFHSSEGDWIITGCLSSLLLLLGGCHSCCRYRCCIDVLWDAVDVVECHKRKNNAEREMKEF